MTQQSFFFSNLNDLLNHFSVVNITDPIPEESSAFLQQSYLNSVYVTGTQLTKEMMNAIITRSTDAFRQNYCEIPFLIIYLDKATFKTALQRELVFFLNVRKYKKLPTILRLHPEK